jgi:glycosyltransferase involved in cell wall biosynthesis
LRETIRSVCEQTYAPIRIIVCYTVPEDVLGLEPAPAVTLLLAPPGTTVQRNRIIETAGDSDIVVFLDDDFLPAPRYVEAVIAAFASAPDIVATTGAVIADGATGPGFGFEAAQEMLRRDTYNGQWPGLRPAQACYGCNMAFLVSCLRAHQFRFDERLPLYAWWEDIDFTRRLANYGRVVEVHSARGVHLGVKLGRTSGLRLGYSQVANPLYMARKGSVPWRLAAQMTILHTVVNFFRSASPESYVDRRGRLKGNLLAWWDVARGIFRPEKILEFS